MRRSHSAVIATDHAETSQDLLRTVLGVAYVTNLDDLHSALSVSPKTPILIDHPVHWITDISELVDELSAVEQVCCVFVLYRPDGPPPLMDDRVSLLPRTPANLRLLPQLVDCQHVGLPPTWVELFENSRAVQTILDAETLDIVDANEAAAAFYGRSRQALRRMNIRNFNQDEPPILEQVRLQGWDAPQSYLFQDQTADGQLHWVDVQTSPMQVNGRRLIHCILTDVTDHMTNHTILAEIRHHNMLVSENITDIVTRMDLETRFLYLSPSVKRVLGHHPTSLIGHKFQDLVHPEDTVIVDQAISALHNRPIVYTFSNRMRHKNGHYVWLET
ncbi:MAG: PAS domain S-box protein, partial [Chloroflexi bacterium]|nr:PAS domain S-box protein [Chloroflexota bacterium]